MHRGVTPSAPTAIAPRTTTAHHRYDLEGVRGIAVALVVVFHVYFGRVSGGVDVFLVLSGFFFTGSLLRAAQNGSVRPGRTLWRTVRRLVPSLTIVLAAVAVCTVLLKPRTQWAGIGDQVVASLFHVQNWHSIGLTDNYSAADRSISPLQHLWSVSVQGQFFLAAVVVFAALTWARRRYAVPLNWAVGVAAVTLGVWSATHAVALRADAQQANAYYDTFARGWELMVGVLLAVVVSRISVPRVGRWVATLAGLAMLFTSGILIDGAMEFPGPLALYPVGAAVLLILGGCAPTGDDVAPTHWLSSAPLRRLGAWSYPLYLWHWPVLIFYLGFVDEPSDPWLVIAVSVVLAYLTHRFVETPLRPRSGPSEPRRHLVLASAVAALAVVMVASSAAWNHQLARQSGPPDTVALSPLEYPGARAYTDNLPVPDAPFRPSALEASRDLPTTTLDGCISDFDTTEIRSCVYGDPDATRTIALVGGSHSEHWISALDPIGTSEHVKIVTYLKMGCPLTVDIMPLIGTDDYPGCLEWSAAVMDELALLRPNFVFTTSTRPAENPGTDFTPDYYTSVWTRLMNDGLDVVAIRDTPWILKDGNPVRAVDCLSDGGSSFSCGMPRGEVLAPDDPAVLAVGPFPNMRLMDLTDGLCDDIVCPAVVGNVLVYHDSHHLSATFVRTLVPALSRQLGDATGWW